MATTLKRLGDISVARFMREYWQRRPLLIRAAFPGFATAIGRERMFQLAAREEVESRLVERIGPRWSLRQGPFARLPPPSHPAWTLLIQGLDTFEDEAHALMSRFRFLPDARLDDLMASYATDRGGVGPHFDHYDVFLLQAAGRRRWRTGAPDDLRLRPDQPLKLLQKFRADQTWILEPGDMLYLPPGIPHEGVALGECITWSIGFRAARWQELLDPWFAGFAEGVDLTGGYTDRGVRATRRPASLPPGMVDQVHSALSRARPTRADTRRFLLRHLSEPKASVVFSPRGPIAAPAFRRMLRERGLQLDRRSRLLTDAQLIGINGEVLAPEAADLPVLRELAHGRTLPPGRQLGSRTLLTLLKDWYEYGWAQAGAEPGADPGAADPGARSHIRSFLMKT